MTGRDPRNAPDPDPLHGGGVHRLPGPVRALERELARAGWRTGVVSGAGTRREALAAIGRALAFPAWYGQNLDALADCLGDLTAPTALLWAGQDAFAAAHPRDAAAIERVLADRAARRPPFALVLLTGGAR